MSTAAGGVRFIIGAAFSFSAMGLFVKWAGLHLPSQELVFVRSLSMAVLNLALLRHAGVHPLGNRRGLLVLRGLYGFGGLSCHYYAVTHLPLAEATLLSYLHPIFTALLATRVLGERADRSLVASLALGSAGVVLVTRPFGLLGGGATPLDPFAVAVALGGAFFVACAYVGVRQLTATEHPLVIVLCFPLVAAPASLPGALAAGVWPRGFDWVALAGMTLFAQLGQVWITRGLAIEPAGRATALSYLQIAFAALWGVAFFGEVPGVATLAGTALIAVSTTLGAVNLGAGRSRQPEVDTNARPLS